jgi:catechol 2,3-dioxygenase-like lactoylglutathione lyase family enzyme
MPTELLPAAGVTEQLNKVSAISLFVEDLETARTFYRDVFGVDVVFEDDNSVCVKFDSLFVNLLHVSAAIGQVEPGVVAAPDAGSRFQLSIWLDDVDGTCALLKRRGVEILTGPTDREWGMRTATFTDPAGNSWEIAQQISPPGDS